MDANTNPSTEPQTFVITRIRLIKETFRITGETEEEAYALLALGRKIDIAINADAIAMHRANHPDIQHLCENVR